MGQDADRRSRGGGGPVTFSSCTPPGCNVPSNEVQVTVTYPFNLSIPFINSQSLNITSTSSMVITQ